MIAKGDRLKNFKKFWKEEENRIMVWTGILVILMFLTFSCERKAGAETNGKKDNLWLMTAYCNCKKCCGKNPGDSGYGITASGKQTCPGCCACNWLPFGTKVTIAGIGEYTVMDRGAKSLFGSRENHILHIDIWFPSHREALNFGKQYRKVVINQLTARK